jgi:hypothetical protein
MKYFILLALFSLLTASDEVSDLLDNKQDEVIPCKMDGDCGGGYRCSLFKYCYRLSCMKHTDCLKV